MFPRLAVVRLEVLLSAAAENEDATTSWRWRGEGSDDAAEAALVAAKIGKEERCRRRGGWRRWRWRRSAVWDRAVAVVECIMTYL
mmetsp:Transcript_11426/g.28155  ORF Transcript_11426/g.28155 Transcript_11426/m.28155 type:complete len:85 (+) Transcript_11426:2935-3189(+)